MDASERTAIKIDFWGAVRKHEELWELVEKLDSGGGTYAEVDKIAEIVGGEFAKYIQDKYSDELLEILAEKSHELVLESAVTAQQNLNNAARIGIKPMKTKVPKSKVSAIAEAINATDNPLAVINNQIPTLVIGMADDIMKYNMDFQAKAGMKPVIVREWSGRIPSHDTKHTDWCKNLAGVYEYGTEPKEVYARHEGCTCKVSYYPNRLAQGRITALAKGTIDIDGVLWNTKMETLEKRLTKNR